MTLSPPRPAELGYAQSFSFYVNGRDPERIRACAEQADAVVVCGPAGPASVKWLRAQGWEGVALFDRAAYLGGTARVDAARWFGEQRAAGAERLLTPGCWVSAGNDHDSFMGQIGDELALAQRHGATCVISIDHRWLTKGNERTEILRSLERLSVPTALVLAHEKDPLGSLGAVDGLVALTRRVEDLTILRCDHGAIGALAFDAVHGSIGLQASHRHAVPPDKQASGIPNDRSARVFVPELMDWFTASTIGGWSTIKVSPTCSCECCRGAPIVRFLDDRLRAEADLHNRNVLSSLALHILEVPEVAERRRAFGRLCFGAVERYGDMGGYLTEITPKSQLVQWAAYA